MQVELDDLDGVRRQLEGEVAAHVVQCGLDGDDAFGVVDGVCGLGIGRADAHELGVSGGVRSGE